MNIVKLKILNFIKMKTLQFTIASVTLLFIGIIPTWSQNNRMPKEQFQMDKIYVFPIGADKMEVDSIAQVVIDIYKRNHIDGFNQAKMPHFIITDRKAKAMFTVGGFVQFRGGYDFNNVIGNTDFVTYNIPMMQTPQNREGLLMDASTSRLFFKALFLPGTKNQVETYIETDFRGSGNTLRLRQAYVKYAGFTFGQTVSLVTDLSASFNTIDFQGPNAYPYLRNLGVHYNLNMGKGWSMAVGLEYPVLSATAGRFVEMIPQRIPDVPLYFQYSWDKGQSHVRATGLLRNMYYYNNVNNNTEHAFGYGAQISTTIQVAPQVQFYGNAIWGKGIGNYINDLEGNNYDLMPSRNNGQLFAPETFAWLAGAQFNITAKMPLTVGYSQVLVNKGDQMVSGNAYKLSQYIVGNLFYNFNSVFSVGVEYLYGTRYDFNDDFGKANRVQAMIQVNF